MRISYFIFNITLYHILKITSRIKEVKVSEYAARLSFRVLLNKQLCLPPDHDHALSFPVYSKILFVENLAAIM